MIEVFATDIENRQDARVIQGLFSIVFPRLDINFDLGDTDHVLRIESRGPVDSGRIISYVKNLGYAIRILE